MKKTTLLLVLLIAFYSCTEKKTTDRSVATTEATASKRTTFQDSVPQIIRDLQFLACKANDYSVIEKYHKIDMGLFESMLVNYWGDVNAAKYKAVSWEEIKKKLDSVSCNEKYLSFKYNNSGMSNADDIEPVLVSTFSDKTTCFSVPLFRSIMQNHDVMASKHTIEFTKGKMDPGADVNILFRIKGSGFTGYYDISLDPTFIGLKENE
ncbi:MULTISPECIES: hypothetical protein [unclassified Flavobacterium]|uniref:hypothetical protein n=1 Tax=unclassified Flavobacterium TaxID=196869 RepID=UPI00086BBE93|nr:MULTISPECIES: hypothetical protein [unclassified Flavobacterium]MBN9284929.1 hypothetical protein [Flavobacterium sp.]ODS77403.1 MAG: hypothetical protein ABS44_22625 [Chryseobacterium sp. SCN 40-13]OJV72240.1 MAG: hypothetical protein BGO42_03375 [Flavobacterium sp. 40-81]